MIKVYYVTTTNPLCRACKCFDSVDDAIQWAETTCNLLTYFIDCP